MSDSKMMHQTINLSNIGELILKVGGSANVRINYTDKQSYITISHSDRYHVMVDGNRIEVQDVACISKKNDAKPLSNSGVLQLLELVSTIGNTAKEWQNDRVEIDIFISQLNLNIKAANLEITVNSFVVLPKLDIQSANLKLTSKEVAAKCLNIKASNLKAEILLQYDQVNIQANNANIKSFGEAKLNGNIDIKSNNGIIFKRLVESTSRELKIKANNLKLKNFQF